MSFRIFQSLVKSSRDRLRAESLKIKIVSVLTPDEYEIQWESNNGTRKATVQLTDISPKLKFGWDSSDYLRVRRLLLSNPYSDKQTEAFVFKNGEQMLIEDVRIHENGQTINLKNWLREQEIIR